MMNVQINNAPKNFTGKRWIVCRAVDGEVWFYDMWPSDMAEDAKAQAAEINGFIVENSQWLK